MAINYAYYCVCHRLAVSTVKEPKPKCRRTRSVASDGLGRGLEVGIGPIFSCYRSRTVTRYFPFFESVDRLVANKFSLSTP